MESRGMLWGILLIGNAFLLLHCDAFMADSRMEKLSPEKDDDRGHIMKIARRGEFRMPKMDDDIMTFLESMQGLQEDSGVVKKHEQQLEETDREFVADEPPKVLTYKDLCQVLGNWQMSREKNQYNMRPDVKHKSQYN